MRSLPIEKTLEIIPTHGGALDRLAALGEDVAAVRQTLTPQTRCDVNFGGKVRLLGFTCANGPPSSSITLIWEFVDRMDSSFHPVVQLLDDSMALLSRNDFRFQDRGMVYQVDYPALGQVVAQTEYMSGDLSTVRYLRIRYGRTPLRRGSAKCFSWTPEILRSHCHGVTPSGKRPK